MYSLYRKLLSITQRDLTFHTKINTTGHTERVLSTALRCVMSFPAVAALRIKKKKKCKQIKPRLMCVLRAGWNPIVCLRLYLCVCAPPRYMKGVHLCVCVCVCVCVFVCVSTLAYKQGGTSMQCIKISVLVCVLFASASVCALVGPRGSHCFFRGAPCVVATSALSGWSISS